MLFQRINRSDPEKIFVVVKNSWSTASLTNGQVVDWDFTTDKDGVGVSKPTAPAAYTTGPAGFATAGVAAETIAAGSYGLIQVYGYHSAVRMRTMTSTGHTFHEATQPVALGTPLASGLSTGFMAEGIAAGGAAAGANCWNLHPFAFALVATAGFTTIAQAAFIKAL